MNSDTPPPEWSREPLLAELERGLIWNQALTMANHAELLRRAADTLGTRSALAELLSAEADRVLRTIERETTRAGRPAPAVH